MKELGETLQLATCEGAWLKRILLGSAIVVSLAAGLHGVADPWEEGWRGMLAAQWSQGSVLYHMHYGLSQTGGYPVVMVEHADAVERIVNWHHPATYWLLLTGPATIFGNTPCVLRCAQLLLWAPGMFALAALMAARFGWLVGGASALLFAGTPLLAYYGPMVLQDGAAVSLGLIALYAFDCWVRKKDAWRGWLAAVAFFFCCTIEFQGFWWGVSMFCLVIGRRPIGLMAMRVAVMATVSFAALGAIAVHFGMCMGGPIRYLKQVTNLVGGDVDQASAVTWSKLGEYTVDLMVNHGNWPVVMLAALGCCHVVVYAREYLPEVARVASALAAPGVLACMAMPSHAIGHVFWPMHGFAVFGAMGAMLLASARHRVPAVAVIAFVAVFGAWKTHEIVVARRTVEDERHAILQAAAPHLGKCTWTFTNMAPVTQVFFGSTWVIGGIDSPAEIAACIAMARGRGQTGDLGFVLGPGAGATELAPVLAGLAKPIVVGSSQVFRFRP